MYIENKYPSDLKPQRADMFIAGRQAPSSKPQRGDMSIRLGFSLQRSDMSIEYQHPLCPRSRGAQCA